jgi:hypothetical protein
MGRRVIVKYALHLPVLDPHLLLLPFHRHFELTIEIENTSEDRETLGDRKEKNKNT